MTISRGEIKGQILRVLMKTSLTPGFYEDDSINDAIQEAIDLISTEMFMADEGWQTKLMYFDTVASQISVDIPPNIAMIKEVRYLLGNVYCPMVYDDANRREQYSDDSGVNQWAYTYRVIDNAFYFNPCLAEGGTKFLQIEYMGYPKTLQSDQDTLETHFDRAMVNFIKYRACTILASYLEKFAMPWANIEADWFARMQAIIVKRNIQTTQIREFEG